MAAVGRGVSDYKGGELGFTLDGNLPDRCKLDASVSMKTDGFKASPSLHDAVHCMCLVVPCESATDEAYMSRLQEMRQFARDRGVGFLSHAQCALHVVYSKTMQYTCVLMLVVVV